MTRPVLERSAQPPFLACARRLAEAGLPTTSVRYNGTLHDFMMLNPVRDTQATSAAVAQAAAVLRHALHHGKDAS